MNTKRVYVLDVTITFVNLRMQCVSMFYTSLEEHGTVAFLKDKL